MSRFLIFVAFVLAAGCQDSQASSALDAPPWYRRAVARNLTQSREPDSIVITARGVRSDSLHIHLAIVVDGSEAYATDWESKYELVGSDTALINSPRLDSLMRSHLDRVFTSFAEEPLDTASMRLNGDTALLRTLARPLPHQIMLSYGYRSTIALIWDPRERRFLKAYECC